MTTSLESRDPFLQLTRYLLVDHIFFAQLLAALPKQLKADIEVPLAISWIDNKPVIYYQLDQLNLLLEQEELSVQSIIHELIHLLLGHTSINNEADNFSLFHLATDIQTWSWMVSYFKNTPDYLKPFQSFFQEARHSNTEEIIHSLKQNSHFYSKAKTIENHHFKSHKFWMKNDLNTNRNTWNTWWNSVHPSLSIQLLNNELRQHLELLAKHSFPPLPWHLILRRFTANASRTYNKSSLRRPSKRYGTIPGTTRKRRQNLLIIIDTSGSINESMLQRFFTEIQFLYQQGAQVMLLQADQLVHEVVPYKGKTPKWIWGRGGTSFDPALKYANDHGPFDAVIYFTDGEGAKPRIECRWSLLWIVIDNDSRIVALKKLD